MAHEMTDHAVELPLIRTGSIAVVVCVTIALLGGIISEQRGGVMSDGIWTLAATIPGVLIPMSILLMMPAKDDAPSWSVPVLAGTMIRALIVLSIGLVIYMTIEPARIVFFLTMLMALMATLVVDVAGVLSLIQKHTPAMMASVDAEGIS